MKKKKLKLDELKVASFITKTDRLKGGNFEIDLTTIQQETYQVQCTMESVVVCEPLTAPHPGSGCCRTHFQDECFTLQFINC